MYLSDVKGNLHRTQTTARFKAEFVSRDLSQDLEWEVPQMSLSAKDQLALPGEEEDEEAKASWASSGLKVGVS